MFLGAQGWQWDAVSSQFEVCFDEKDATAQQEVAIGGREDDMELPHDLAMQALEATGGKSNLRATQWILDRRSEVQQHELRQVLAIESPNASEQEQRDEAESGAEERGNYVGKGPGEEDIWSSSHLPSAPLWGSSVHGAPLGGGSVPNAIPVSMERRGTSSLERHASIGSSSPLDRAKGFGEGKTPVKREGQSKTSHSPEPDEGRMMASSMLARLASAPMQGANYKRKRQDETDITHARPLAIAQSIPRPIAMRLEQESPPSGKAMAPLAERMRPTSIAEIIGQDHLLGPHCVLRSLLNDESLPSIIIGGPPGSGKTSLARLIARSASCRFVALSSAKGGTSDIQEILDEAKQARKFGQRTVLFVETLGRFNKSQQECVLPSIEAGYIVFIGATTENPSTEVISGLLLRVRVFTLKKLQPDHLCTVMKRGISDQERGVLVSLGDVSGLDFVAIEDEVIQFLSVAADGDARVALNALEAAVFIALGKLESRRGIDGKGKPTAAPDHEFISSKLTADREKPIEENSSLARRDAPFDILEHLKGNFQFSQEEYARPFKRIVGGKDVTGTTRHREAHKLSSDRDMKGRSAISGAVKEEKDREISDRKVIIGDSFNRNTTQGDVETRLLVAMPDAMEAFEWPHSVLEKTQEEIDRDLISALLKSIRGGDSNAAVYWLARILENSEWSLLAANALLNFASEEVGMADPQALVQAVACYQACQFLGMRNCSSHLTQCAVYLSMAPKSAALPQAFQSALKVVQGVHHDPVPSHLLSASVGVKEELGYLPASLQNLRFLRWSEI